MRHFVSGSTYRELMRRLGRLQSELANPDGSRIDPVLLIQTLDVLLSGKVFELTITPKPVEDEFLYLSLPPEVLTTDIQMLGLKTTTYNILKRHGIDTIEDLLERSAADLLDIAYFGPRLLEELNRALAVHGWHLSRHDDPDLAPPSGDEWITFNRYSGAPRRVLKSRLHSRK